MTLPQAAMAFPLRHPVVAGIVVGMRSAEEAQRNAESLGAGIPAQVWADLRGEGLLDERAPAGRAVRSPRMRRSRRPGARLAS